MFDIRQTSEGGPISGFSHSPPRLVTPCIGEPTVRLAKMACLAFAVTGLAITACVSSMWGDTLRLKSGLTFSGRAVKTKDLPLFSSASPRAGLASTPTGTVWMVDDGPGGPRRLFVPTRQEAEFLAEKEMKSSVAAFHFTQHKTGQLECPTQIGTFSRVEEFDKFGHGMVQLQTTKGPVDIYLGIVELRPDYACIESLTHAWTFARTTQSLGPEVVETLLNQKVDRTDVVDRRKLIAFYEQAEMYKLARQEVQLLDQDFPAEKAFCERISTEMDVLDATRVLNEITRRRTAGQHQLAEGAAKTFPIDKVSAKIGRDVTQIVTDYATLRERRSHILLQLDMLQSVIPADEAAKLRPLRSLLEEELNASENIDRMAPFEQVADDPQLAASQKLALAFSSWVVGPSDAVESIPAALRMWETRFLMLEYLRTPDDTARRQEILQKLEETDDVSVERLARMVEFLPAFEDSAPIPHCVPTTLDVTSDGAGMPLSYTIVLPKEYNPQHTYPLLVVLHSRASDPTKEASWWAGDADREGQTQRRGFITIAPRYAQPKQEKYEYDLAAHRAVLGSIRHAMRTHRIDANRVILAGHGMGADACFDLGMSHPDLFAGVAPICGKSQKFCHYYYGNAKKLPWYVVAGEGDRISTSINMRDLNRYFSTGADIIYCEFKGRGTETYGEELPRLMDWAETVRRKPISEFLDFKVGTLRSFDNRFHWMQAGTLPADLFEPIIWEDSQKHIRERSIEAKITVRGGAIYVNHPGKTTTIWLSPENLPYEKTPFDQRVHITINGAEKYNGIPKPTAEALLEDLRIRADRQRLFWVRLDL